MYTFKEAEIILDYYAEKVLGKPLNSENASSLPIFKSKIEELENGTYDVFCYGKGSPSTHFYTRIEKVANDLQLISPREVLKLKNLD